MIRKFAKMVMILLFVFIFCATPITNSVIEVKADTKEALKAVKKKLKKNKYKFEASKYTDDGDLFECAISYKKISNILSFTFAYTVSDGDDYICYAARLDGTKSMSGKTMVVVAMSDGYTAYTGVADLTIEKIGKSPSLKFKITDEYDDDYSKDSDLQEACNGILEMGLGFWNSFLKNKTGYKLKDIGFNSYK